MKQPRQGPRPRFFLKDWRNHRGLSQEALAAAVGVTQGQISQLERGLINYTQPMLESLADALDCEPADLLTRGPQDPSGIWELWDGFDSADRRRAIRLLEGLKRASEE